MAERRAGDAPDPVEVPLVRVGSVTALLVRRERTVTAVGAHEILAFAVGDRIHALSNQCTHSERLRLDNAELLPASGEIRCIWHGGRFSLETGEATRLPCRTPIRTYRVVIRGDDVYVPVPADGA